MNAPPSDESGSELERVLDRLKWLAEYGVEINLRKDEAKVLLSAVVPNCPFCTA